jgi:hypothetical protein
MGQLNEARLRLAEVPEGAELVADGSLMFPAVTVRNIYILPACRRSSARSSTRSASGSVKLRST